jgi:hypothetical protein
MGLGKVFKKALKDAGRIGQGAIDVARGKKDPIKVVKKWTDELEDEVSKFVGSSLKASGDILEFIGHEAGRAIKFTETATRDIIKVNQKFIELHIDAVDAITPDGPWRIDLGVAEIKSSKSIDERLRDYNNELADELGNATTIVKDIFKIHAEAIEYSGILTQELGYYIAASSEGFPTHYDNPRLTVDNTHKEIKVSSRFLSAVLDKLSNKEYKYGDGEREYIRFGKISISSLENLNSLELSLSDGIVG